jgi:hypothetical protein
MWKKENRNRSKRKTHSVCLIPQHQKVDQSQSLHRSREVMLDEEFRFELAEGDVCCRYRVVEAEETGGEFFQEEGEKERRGGGVLWGKREGGNDEIA